MVQVTPGLYDSRIRLLLLLERHFVIPESSTLAQIPASLCMLCWIKPGCSAWLRCGLYAVQPKEPRSASSYRDKKFSSDLCPIWYYRVPRPASRSQEKCVKWLMPSMILVSAPTSSCDLYPVWYYWVSHKFLSRCIYNSGIPWTRLCRSAWVYHTADTIIH